MDDQLGRIITYQKIRSKLHRAGVFPIAGPTGPRGVPGRGIQILGAYNSFNELIKHHPVGAAGDCYLVNGILYVWNVDNNTWIETENIQGPPGISEKIEVRSTTTGDPDTDAQVIDNFDGKLHQLDFIIPKGMQGDQGIKGEKGDQGATGPQGPRGLPGETGISEVITIDSTETLNYGESAEVQDDFDRNIHHLTFYIPMGEPGKVGPTGPTGPAGPLSPVSYNASVFASYTNTKNAGIAKMRTTRSIPGISNYIEVPNDTDIQIKVTGVFEIIFCGKITGVSNDIGASFYLKNVTEDKVVSDLKFILSKGTTPDMDFSLVSVVDIIGPATLNLITEIDGDASQSNVEFLNINILIKRYV